MADEVAEEDEGLNEREPLVQPTYLLFRQGRQPQNPDGWSVCSGLILSVFKVGFCSLGLWGRQRWRYIQYILRALFVMICITHAGYQISFDCSCPFFDCNYYNKTHHQNKTNEFQHTRETCFTIFSLAAFFSYSIFLVCLIASSSQDSAMMTPSKSMAEVVDRKEITLLFFVFIIIVASFLSGIVLLFIFEFKGKVNPEYVKHIYVIATTVVLTHWASFNTCHVFAISSFSLGKYLVKHLERVRAYVIAFILEENKI